VREKEKKYDSSQAAGKAVMMMKGSSHD
jgi:hypothetical protein